VVNNASGQVVASGNSASLTFVPSAAGQYTATYTVTDDDGGVGSGSVIMTVVNNNIAPDPTISGPTAGVREEPLTFILQASDSTGNSSGTFAYSIYWGDSSPAQTVTGPGTGVSVVHDYGKIGSFTIRATATDSSGQVSPVVTHTVQIGAVLLAPDPLAPGKTILLVGGTPGNDRIKVQAVGGKGEFEVTINGQRYGRFRPTSRVVVYGGEGNDRLEADGRYSIPVWLEGGPGDDFLKAGNGPTLLLGGSGNDILIGGGGRDIIVGGPGRDKLVAGGGEDIIVPDNLVATDKQFFIALGEWSSADSRATRISKLTQWGVFSLLFEDGQPDRVIANKHKDWIIDV
jgi:Ca2+-binding RTX toxin-like protein